MMHLESFIHIEHLNLHECKNEGLTMDFYQVDTYDGNVSCEIVGIGLFGLV